QRADTPLHIEVCANGNWEQAAMLGPGWVNVGGIMVADHIDIAKSPKAIPLPDNVEFVVPINQSVKFRVRSHEKLVSGGIFTNATLSSCTVTAAFAPEGNDAYIAVWHREAKGCSLGLAKVVTLSTGRSEQVVPMRETDSSCPK
ncbi:MAG TPA: hypothetical protein PLW86_12600, partial [Rhodocyclaceae bacterium]|nr:hypothetical protein [Rhodocyclaceae bacterium]